MGEILTTPGPACEGDCLKGDNLMGDVLAGKVVREDSGCAALFPGRGGHRRASTIIGVR